MDGDHRLEMAWPSAAKIFAAGWSLSMHGEFLKISKANAYLMEECDASDQMEVAAAIIRLADRVLPKAVASHMGSLR